MVTHQLQVERRTGKVRRPETDVLQLSHATNHGVRHTLHIFLCCVIGLHRSEREVEMLNEKLTAELSDKSALASKQLQCSHDELNQLKSELAKVSAAML